MKICVFTLGCKVNASESDSIVRDLIGRGYEVTEELEPADLYIIRAARHRGIRQGQNPRYAGRERHFAFSGRQGV